MMNKVKMMTMFTTMAAVLSVSASAAYAEAVTESEAADIPRYICLDDEEGLFQAEYDYVTDYTQKMYKMEDVVATVPVVMVYPAEVEDGYDFYGIFTGYNFAADGEILSLVSGGTQVGRLRIEENGDTYSYNEEKSQMAEDGEGFDESLKEICGDQDGFYEAIAELLADDSARDMETTNKIAEYVLQNDLPYTAYTLGGEKTINLSEAVLSTDYDDYGFEEKFGSQIVNEADDYVEEEAVDGNPVMNLVGQWQDKIGQRAVMHIACEGENGAVVVIDWATDANTNTRWILHGTMDEDGVITYKDGVKETETFEDEETSNVVEEYADGEGTISPNEDGTLSWTDNKENAGEECAFEWAY